MNGNTGGDATAAGGGDGEAFAAGAEEGAVSRREMLGTLAACGAGFGTILEAQAAAAAGAGQSRADEELLPDPIFPGPSQWAALDRKRRG